MKQIYQSLSKTLLLVVCLGASAAARADQVVLQTYFQSPGTSLDTTYGAGTNVGREDSFLVAQGSVVIPGVSIDPASTCIRAGNPGPSSQCLVLTSSASDVPLLISNKKFGAGDYLADLELAGGPSTAELIVLQMIGSTAYDTVSANTPFRSYQFGLSVSKGKLSPLVINGGGGVIINTITVTQLDSAQPVPEPATMLLLGTGLVGIASRVRKGRMSSPDVQVGRCAAI